MSRKYSYKIKRIIIHFIRPLIENCLFINGITRAELYRFIGYKNIGYDVWIGKNVYLDETNPLGIIIGKGSTITMGAVLLSHYYDTKQKRWFDGSIQIGNHVFIGCNVVIAKPIICEDNVIIGAGTIVTKNLAKNSIYAGSPARFIGSNVL